MCLRLYLPISSYFNFQFNLARFNFVLFRFNFNLILISFISSHFNLMCEDSWKCRDSESVFSGSEFGRNLPRHHCLLSGTTFSFSIPFTLFLFPPSFFHFLFTSFPLLFSSFLFLPTYTNCCNADWNSIWGKGCYGSWLLISLLFANIIFLLFYYLIFFCLFFKFF